jgi:hypothetical protein
MMTPAEIAAILRTEKDYMMTLVDRRSRMFARGRWTREEVEDLVYKMQTAAAEIARLKEDLAVAERREAR